MNPSDNKSTTKQADKYNGQVYEQFRPKYPQRFIDKIRSESTNKRNYLDIATGTGQVLFELYDLFSSLVVAQDLSESMMAVTQQKVGQLKQEGKADQEFKFVPGDVHNIVDLLAKQNIEAKFDLVTIGEAFHWLKMEYMLELIKEKLIEKGGSLAILSYPAPTFELNSKDEELNQEIIKAFKEYKDTTHLDSGSSPQYDSEALENGYLNIPFKKYFDKVERETEKTNVPSSIDGVIGNLRSWTHYVQYVQKYGSEPGWIDPVEVLREKMEKVVEKARENDSLLDKDKPLLFIVIFSLVICT